MAATRIPDQAGARSRGFTLIELVVTFAIIALLFALVVPNLGAFIPSARLDGTSSQIQRQLDWVRSEARIQAKRMTLEFDLQHARWRIVFPPEQKLTRDQDAAELEERTDQWQDLEDDVVFLGIGDAKNGITSHGLYRIVFDEYGFTGDQVILLTLTSDPTMIWSLVISGLSGQVAIEKSETGQRTIPDPIGEGAF